MERALAVTAAASGPACAAGTCLLTNSLRPMRSGLYQPDSAGLLVPLGNAVLQLRPGDSVTLSATVSPDLAAGLPSDEQVVVVAGGDTVLVALRTDSTGTVVYRANVAADSVRFQVGLTRRLTAVPRSGAFSVSLSYGSAPLLEAWTPWVTGSARPAGAARAEATSAATCTATAPGPATGPGACTAITVGIAPYAPGDPFGDFQSDPGTGVSNPITVTFSQPVQSVTLTIEDPTYDGNAMTAYRADGSVAGTVSFAGSGVPGIDIPDSETITAAGMVRIVLTPAPLDYVAYSGLTFVPEAAAAAVKITKATAEMVAPEGLGRDALGLSVAVVSRATGQYLPNRLVTLSLTVVERDAGHAHSASAGWSPSLSPRMTP
ncbi:MAG TPA: hypothetical protein VMT21_13035 [Gemmatimonadales bacterium]|nr:hypothetical protein [Gemmatimonadales bacterium]